MSRSLAWPLRSDWIPTAGTVTVGGGQRYGELCQFLESSGFALANLASLPHISIAGSCATASHGSGVRNPNLAAAAAAVEIVRADGEIERIDRTTPGDALHGAVVSLGALGVVSSVTLDIEPTFRMRQVVYEDLALSELVDHFDEIVSSAYSVSLFTDWSGPSFHQVWLKARLDATDGSEAPAQELFGARLADRDLHPIRGFPAEACTPQMGRPGPWHERLPHFRLDHTPSAGDELQSEYLVGRADAVAALLAVEALRARLSPLVLVSEIRTVAADELWLSPAYRRDSVAIHFTWRPESAASWTSCRTSRPCSSHSSRGPIGASCSRPTRGSFDRATSGGATSSRWPVVSIPPGSSATRSSTSTSSTSRPSRRDPPPSELALDQVAVSVDEQVAPGARKCLLDGVLRPFGIVGDHSGDGIETRDRGGRRARGVAIASPCPDHEIAIHRQLG